MSVVIGLCLSAGVMLLISPWLWPAQKKSPRRPRQPSALRLLLDAAGWARVAIGTFITVSVLSGILSAGALLGTTGLAILAGLGGIAGTSLPTAAARWRRAVNAKKGRHAWPDVIDHIVGSVRSGVALPDAVAALATVGPPALRPAFADYARSYSSTGSFGIGADELKARLADPVADRILETLRMAREVGGTELTTVLQGLAQHLRQDSAIRNEIEARQSWVSNAAKLGVAAPWIVLLLLCSRPEAAAAYNTPSGMLLLAVGAGVSVVAYRVMLAIGRLPSERRWFR